MQVRTPVACSRRMVGSKVEREERGFATTASGLLALPEWLSSLCAIHIAMAATGVYLAAGVKFSKRRRV